MSFPPTVGASYLTREGRTWTVVSVDEDGAARSVKLSTDDRDVDEYEVLEEEWTDFETAAKGVS